MPGEHGKGHGHGSFPPIKHVLLGLNGWDEHDYLVPQLERFQGVLGSDVRLPTSADTQKALVALADSFPSQQVAESNIPAPYTYLGQFIDHDITLTVPVGNFNPDAELQKSPITPVSPETLPRLVRNRRTSGFDLDCLYGSQPDPGEEELAVPFEGDKFVLGKVSAVGNRPPGKADDNDLPRVAQGKFAKRARIGDPRNDENLIVSQLHLAFMKLHNAVVDEGNDFDCARRLVTLHYQWMVVTDFLPRICDPAVVKKILVDGNKLYKPRHGEKYMPFEFAVAAYRFGHSMVRSDYDFNLNFKKQGGAQGQATLDLLFKFTGLKGDFFGQPTLPENWIAQWEMLLKDRAMQIDPSLTPFLHDMPEGPVEMMKQLSKRNLLRGYLFSLPTGQALASAVLSPPKRMTPDQILAGCRPEAASAGAKPQRKIVEELGLHKRTPLWLYILAEAKVKGGGNRLGPLGSLIVAETMIGLIRGAKKSILNQPFVPTLGAKPGRFDLQDLLVKAGVLGARVPE